MDRADGLGVHGLGGNRPGDSKIRHLHLAVHGNNHILGLNIPVNDMVSMSRLDALGHLEGDTRCLPCFQLSLFLNIAFQGDAVDQLHYNIMKLPFVHYVIHVYNIGVGETGRRLGFHLKLLHKSLVGGKFLF